MVLSCSRCLEEDHSKNQVANNLHVRNQGLKFKKDGLKMSWLPEQLEDVIRKVVREEMKNALLLCWPSLERSSSIEAASVSRRLRLQLVGTLPNRIFTGSKIEADGSVGVKRLKVVLLDAQSGTKMTNCPFSNIKIEALVLKGDFKPDERMNWSEKDFNESIVVEREGRRPLLIGDRLITLTNGEAFVDGLSFTDNSSWLRSGKFRVALRPLRGLLPSNIGVQEAISGAFEVKDRRGESYQKRSRPSLEDEVWRLYKIAKGGKTAKRLAADGIYTVKDFLHRYNTDQTSLRCILNVSNRVWNAIISHAQSCLLSSEHYLYRTESVGLLFNCVLELAAVTYDGQTFQSLNTLDKFQKLQAEKLRSSACQDRAKLVPVDMPADWATEPRETIIPYVGSSLDLNRLNGQHSDQAGLVRADQSDPMPDPDLSQLSLPISYGAQQYTNSLSELMGSERPVQVPSLVESDSFLFDYGFCTEENIGVHVLYTDQFSPACSVLGEERNTIWYSAVPNSGGATANISAVASTSNSHISLQSTCSEFSANFPVGSLEPKPSWSNYRS